MRYAPVTLQDWSISSEIWLACVVLDTVFTHNWANYGFLDALGLVVVVEVRWGFRFNLGLRVGLGLGVMHRAMARVKGSSFIASQSIR